MDERSPMQLGGEPVAEVKCHRCKAPWPMYELGHVMWARSNAVGQAMGWPRRTLDEAVLCDDCYASWQDFMRRRDEQQAIKSREDLDGFVACALADGDSVAWASYKHRLDDSHWCDRARAILEARKGSGKSKVGGF